MAKDRTTELAGKIRDAATLHDPVARATVELIEQMLEDAKVNLVLTNGDDMLRTQGAARQLLKLHKELTTRPPNINPQNAQEQ